MKRGPKPKDGDRYPSGKLKPYRLETAPSRIRRIVELSLVGSADPLLSTPIGWLRLANTISNNQTAAAVEYARLRGQYDRALDAPARSCASPSYGASFGSFGSTLTDEELAEASKLVIERFYEVEKALTQLAEPVAWAHTTRSLIARLPGIVRRSSIIALLDRVCVENVRPDYPEISDLSRALDCLVSHFRLTELTR